MHEIIDGLWVGDDHDVPKAKQRHFSILSCCKDGPNGHRSMLGYTTLAAPHDVNYYFVERGEHMALNLLDHEDPNFIPEPVINAGLEFIGRKRAEGKRLLTHCNWGKSRSPSVVLLYLRSIGDLPDGYHKGFRIFKKLYPKYDPGQGMEYYVRSHYNDWKVYDTRE